MQVTGQFNIICNKCNNNHIFSPIEVDFEAKYGSERSMGQETGWEWDHEFTCNIEDCAQEIEIEYQVWEYPIGGFNNEIINVIGAKGEGSFDYDFHYPED